MRLAFGSAVSVEEAGALVLGAVVVEAGAFVSFWPQLEDIMISPNAMMMIIFITQTYKGSESNFVDCTDLPTFAV